MVPGKKKKKEIHNFSCYSFHTTGILHLSYLGGYQLCSYFYFSFWRKRKGLFPPKVPGAFVTVLLCCLRRSDMQWSLTLNVGMVFQSNWIRMQPAEKGDDNLSLIALRGGWLMLYRSPPAEAARSQRTHCSSSTQPWPAYTLSLNL